jgi:hypothetical protein
LPALVGPEETGPGLLVCRVPEPSVLPGGHLALPWQRFTFWLAQSLERGAQLTWRDLGE